MNLSWWLERSAWEYPDNTAVVNADGASITYRDLVGLSNRMSNVLVDVGAKPGDVIVSAMPDNYLHVAVFYAAIRLGGAFSGLNYRLSAERLIEDVRTCRATILVVAPEYVDIARTLVAHTSIETVFVTSGNVEDYRDLTALCERASESFRIVDRSQSDIAAVNFTSGTSGRSKAVIFTHGTLGNSAWGAIFLGGVTSQTRNLSLVGMFHSGGIHDSVRMMMAGGTILWSNGWDVERVVRLIQEHRPNWMYWIIPTMMRDLMRHRAWPDLDLAGVRTYVAGEPVPLDVRDALLSKGAQVGNMYGLTEAMPVCVLGPSLYYHEEVDVPVGSSGKPARNFCDVVLKDPTTGAALLGDDVEGEVCIKGDVVTVGYLNDAARTIEAFDDNGYLHTRDVAYRNAEGWYYIRGRTDDIINPGGEKLSLLEIDAVLLRHPDVIDAACVGVAHARFGEAPAAFVQMRPGIDERRARDLLDAFCLEELERWQRPRLYVLVDAVPRTSAKRSKMQRAMRDHLEGLVVPDAHVTTFGELTSAEGPLE